MGQPLGKDPAGEAISAGAYTGKKDYGETARAESEKKKNKDGTKTLVGRRRDSLVSTAFESTPRTEKKTPRHWKKTYGKEPQAR